MSILAWLGFLFLFWDRFAVLGWDALRVLQDMILSYPFYLGYSVTEDGDAKSARVALRHVAALAAFLCALSSSFSSFLLNPLNIKTFP